MHFVKEKLKTISYDFGEIGELFLKLRSTDKQRNLQLRQDEYVLLFTR